MSHHVIVENHIQMIVLLNTARWDSVLKVGEHSSTLKNRFRFNTLYNNNNKLTQEWSLLRLFEYALRLYINTRTNNLTPLPDTHGHQMFPCARGGVVSHHTQTKGVDREDHPRPRRAPAWHHRLDRRRLCRRVDRNQHLLAGRMNVIDNKY